jgi:hypothetical protein
MDCRITDMLGQNGANVPKRIVALKKVVRVCGSSKERFLRIFRFIDERLVTLKDANERSVVDKVLELRD